MQKFGLSQVQNIGGIFQDYVSFLDRLNAYWKVRENTLKENPLQYLPVADNQ